MNLRHKLFESSNPLGLQNEVNVNFLLGKRNEGIDVEIISQSYFVRTDGDGEIHYLSVFYKSSPHSESS